jgi:hypothetical protein
MRAMAVQIVKIIQELLNGHNDYKGKLMDYKNALTLEQM